MKIFKALLGTVIVIKLAVLPSILLKGSSADAAPAKVIVAQEELIDLQGYIIGEPKYIEATNEYQFKFAPKKNKDLKNVYMLVSVPKTAKQQKFYMGDYVKIKTRSSIIQAAIAASGREVAAE